jgi:BMFP domain-containing protein YqiC
MRRYFKTISLLAGLCLASPLLAGQGQAIPPNTDVAADLRERVSQLERRLEDIRAELARARQQLHECSAPATRVKVSHKTNELEQRVQTLSAALDSVKEEMRSAPPAHDVTPESLPQVRIVQSQHRKNLDIDLTSDRGPFALGPNSFCLDFRSTRDGKAIDPGEVRVDFTGAIGKVKAVRALARVAQSGSGHYCGQVTLTTPGEWLVTANFDGPFGSGKAVFTQTVK